MKKIVTLLMAIMVLMTGCASNNGETSEDAETTLSENTEAKTDETSNTNNETSTRTITDIWGREVEIPTEVNSIICTGCGTLRLMCYAQAQDLVVGVEELEREITVKRPYSFVYGEEFKDLPIIGKGGAGGYSAFEEEIIKLKPDIIFSSYTNDSVEQLAEKTGIPVVAISYRSNILDPNIEESMNIIGEVLGIEDRCSEVISVFEDAKKDLNDRTKDIPDEDKLKAYVGAVSFSGGHGFGGTYANYSPLQAINAINVADETGEESAFEVDLEKVVSWNPDVIFLDISNMDLVNEDYKKKPEYFDSLSAIKDGKVYSTISYNWYTTNLELAFANSYYMGKILYPEQFADIDIAEKTDELCEKLLGKPIYADLQDIGYSFGEVTIGE